MSANYYNKLLIYKTFYSWIFNLYETDKEVD